MSRSATERRSGTTISVKSSQDFTVGLLFIVVGSLFAVQAWLRYPMGHAGEMGPGFFPFFLGLILAIIGVGVLLRSLSLASGTASIGRIRVPTFALIMASILFFGVALEWLGLVVTVFVMVFISSMASHEFRWRNALLCGAAVAAFCAVLFVVLLGLQMPLWPALAK
ncbi:tripartite tricarboxylate transporter TctB family protein [soil metagenome]